MWNPLDFQLDSSAVELVKRVGLLLVPPDGLDGHLKGTLAGKTLHAVEVENPDMRLVVVLVVLLHSNI